MKLVPEDDLMSKDVFLRKWKKLLRMKRSAKGVFLTNLQLDQLLKDIGNIRVVVKHLVISKAPEIDGDYNRAFAFWKRNQGQIPIREVAASHKVDEQCLLMYIQTAIHSDKADEIIEKEMSFFEMNYYLKYGKGSEMHFF